MNQVRFEFTSAGDPLVGTLFLPNEAPRGAVVTTGPLTSVKEQAAGVYARAMAERGFIAIAFDHRTFGESGGTPRQFESPQGKAEDIKAAVSALSRDRRIGGLPIFALGVCAGGGYMALAVANGLPVRAFAGVAGVYPSAAQTQVWLGANYKVAIDRARTAEQRWRETGQVETIPAVAADNGDVAMPLSEAYEYYGTPRGAVPNYVNGFAVQSRAYTLPFDVQEMAPSLRAPTIMIHSENALMPALARSFFAALPGKKTQAWMQSKGQIDFYDDHRLIDPAADLIARFFEAEK
jgi:dienelactone hydrolase